MAPLAEAVCFVHNKAFQQVLLEEDLEHVLQSLVEAQLRMKAPNAGEVAQRQDERWFLSLTQCLLVLVM